MAVQIFTGNVIAVIWDFDQTMIPGYQQAPLFKEYGIDQKEFWTEVNGLESRYKESDIVVSKDVLYLNHLLTYAKAGRLPGLTNSRLREFGAHLTFYAGLPEFLETSKAAIEGDEIFKSHGITVEHYVVSNGLRQIMLGSAIAPFVAGVWGCDFIEVPAEPGFLATEDPQPPQAETIQQIGYFLDNTTKTRAIWEINKGSNVDLQIDVNAFIPPEDRRVPLRNMLYIADGPSDIPVFSILNQYGGSTLGVYNASSDEHFENVARLNEQGRIHMMAEANFEEGSTASHWILRTVRKIAGLVVRDRERALTDRVLPPSGHVV